MSTAGSKVGLDTFEQLELDQFRTRLWRKPAEEGLHIESHYPHSTRVLNVGCDTNKPVSEMLSNAVLDVVGAEISPKMIEHAKSRVRTFTLADLLEYEPREDFVAVFVTFSLLQLTSYADFYGLMLKYASAVQPGGYLVLGIMPADYYVKDASDYDESRKHLLLSLSCTVQNARANLVRPMAAAH